MRVGVAATPQVALPTLNWLKDSGHQLELVISVPERRAGRGRDFKSSPVSLWAKQHGIRLITPVHPDDMIEDIQSLDLVITIGYGVLLPEHILKIPRHGFLNMHFSLLPLYRGAAPVQRALEHGEHSTGVTVFLLDKGMDTGPIYSQIEVEIDPTWRTVELLKHLALIGVEALKDAIKMIDQGQSPTAQMGTPTYAPKISKQEARIDFNQDANLVCNKVRAFTDEPGAWTVWKDEPFKITQARVATSLSLTPREIIIKDEEVIVGCGDGTCLSIEKVTPAGKREMSATDWARGARLSGGEHFG